MKKKIISVFIALVLCFSFSFNVVSAEVTSDCFNPSKGAIWSTYISDDYKTQITNALKRLFDRCNLNSDDYYIFIKEVYTYQNAPYINNLNIFPKNGCTEQYKSENNRFYNILVWSSAYRISSTISSLDNINSMSFTSNNGFYKQGVFYNSDVGYGFGEIRDYGNGAVQSSPSFTNSWVFIDTFNPPYIPSPSVLYGLDLDINETDFYNWIIDNNKLVELPSYITANKLFSFIQFYKNFGGSFSNFLKNIPDWFSYMNIVNQSADNVNVLKSSMDKLYQEYINSYWRVIYPDFSNIPTHRRSIRTNTTDTNTTLITDDSNDTVDTSILRDILRGIISINNSVSDGVISIINKLDQLDFTVNVANGGGSFSAAQIWGSGDITQSSNYQALSDVFVQHGVVISNVESLQYNYLAGQNQKDSFTISVDMPDQFVNGEFTKKTVTHTVNSDSKMYDTLIVFRKIIALAVILFYVVRLRLSLPALIKGE